MPRPRKPSRPAVRAGAAAEAARNRPLILLLAAGFLLAGFVLACWSASEIRSLVVSLRAAAPVVETVNGVYALPVLALALFAIGALLSIDAASTWLSEPTADRLAALLLLVTFGSIILVCLLGAAGGFLNSYLMQRQGYEACETRMGTRLSWTLWTNAPGGCAAAPAS